MFPFTIINEGKWNWFYTWAATNVAVIIVMMIKEDKRGKVQFNLTLISWWKEDLKQQDLM